MTDFVHLHVHTDYSLLDGAARIKPLVARAKELGQRALAITDHGNMFGVIHFEKECRAAGIKPIIGCEFYVAGGSRSKKTGTEEGNKYYHLILLAKNETGYRNLVMLTSLSYTEGFYYKPRIDTELLERYHEGLVCLSGCIAGELPQLLLAGKHERAAEIVEYYKKVFGAENYFIEMQNHGLADQKRAAPLMIEVAKRTNTPMVVTNDSHYILKEDWEAQEVMMCIATKKTLKDPRHMTFGTKEFYVKNGDEMAGIFAAYPEMASNTVRIASMCDCKIPQFDVAQLKECLPVYQIPETFHNEEEYIRHLVYSGLEKRYEAITAEIKERAEYELSTIITMGFAGYFLIVWDFINWAKEHDIPIGPGRGSGAGSIAAYAMGITNIDPLRYKLFFERFLNPERVSMPDFDIDISDEGRQDVIEYTRQKYGDKQVGHIATFGTLKAKAVIKDVARVLDIPLDEVAMLTELVPEHLKAHLIDAFVENPKIPDSGRLAQYRNDAKYQHLFDLCFKLEDAKRNASLHASGIVIGKSPLPEWAPVFTVRDKKSKNRKDNYFTATQYTMDIIEPCGLVKMDYLGLKALSIIKRTEQLIRKHAGFENFAIEKIDEHDEKAFGLFCEGKTAAFFQFESAGMQKVLRQAKPRRIEDLIALNALYRPGPMDYIPQFIEGKFDRSKIVYPDPCLKDILEETYGVIVYQEQVMQVAQRIAGYSLGQADLLRRAMSKKKVEVMIAEKQKFIDGAVKKGFDAKHADDIFEILLPFAGYGFNKSHAAAYSIIAYQTAYLKANFPGEFVAANLTNEIYGANDKLASYIEEARGSGLEIRPPDINTSGVIFEVIDHSTIAFGLMGIKGLGEYAAEEIVKKRNSGGAYKSFTDFLERVELHTVNKRAIEVLVKTGSFDSLGTAREVLAANLEKAVEYAEKKKSDKEAGQASLFEESGEQEFAGYVYEKTEPWSFTEKLEHEKELIGCYISGHPLDPYRKIIERCSTITTATAAKAIPAKHPYERGRSWQEIQEERAAVPRQIIIGVVRSLREITTKKGAPMAFATLSDFEGDIDLVFFPDSWEALRGRIQNEMVAAFSGVVDNNNKQNDKTAFQVEKLLDANNLEERRIREVHIRLNTIAVKKDAGLLPLREHLIDHGGPCTVFLHVPVSGGEKIVRTARELRTAGNRENIAALSGYDSVDEVWCA